MLSMSLLSSSSSETTKTDEIYSKNIDNCNNNNNNVKSKSALAEVSESPELEFDMWDGQFEFVGNAYDRCDKEADDDALCLPRIHRSVSLHDGVHFGAQKVIFSLVSVTVSKGRFVFPVCFALFFFFHRPPKIIRNTSYGSCIVRCRPEAAVAALSVAHRRRALL